MTDSSEKKIVALFGGSFDPPHLAHQHIPYFLLAKQFVDQVWYVPVKHHPFGKTVSSDTDRLEMLKLVLQDVQQECPEYGQRVRVETLELEQDKTSYTIETLEALAAKYPEYDFRWVVGSDNVAQFKQWDRYQDILNFGLFVYPRQGYEASPLLSGMTYLSEAPIVAVSSTAVRQNVKAQVDISQMVIPSVAEYIRLHGLYLQS